MTRRIPRHYDRDRDAAGNVVEAVRREIPGLTDEQAEQVVFLRAMADGGFHFTGRTVSVTCIDCQCYGEWRYSGNAADFIASGHRGHRTVVGISNPPVTSPESDDTTDLPSADTGSTSIGRGEISTPPAPIFFQSESENSREGRPAKIRRSQPPAGGGPSRERSDE
jgi:hypothetical protein